MFKSILLAGASLLVMAEVSAGENDNAVATADYFESVRHSSPLVRHFLQNMPKGGELHFHLAGAIYGERILEWAVEDGDCISEDQVLHFKDFDQTCAERGYSDAAAVQMNPDAARQFINAVSVRDFVPSSGWSGHDQFFATFPRMNTEWNRKRFPDMLAVVQNRAAEQNEFYLEMLKTLQWFEMGDMVAGIENQDALIHDMDAFYKAIMAGPFGESFEFLVIDAIRQLDEAEAKSREIMACDTAAAQPGCDVDTRYLYQSVRLGPPAGTFAGFILGYELIKRDARFVGLNLVAPEDWHDAVRYYDAHMAMLDYLWQTQGPRNISLHAGEVDLGLVIPSELKGRIRKAIEVGHAKRIGHGTDIFYEDDMFGVLALMRERGILVETQLTSSEFILGITGADHPFDLYRQYGVPTALSTDDEGVARIDITHEYQRAATSYGLSYDELKDLSRNSLTYSFLSEGDKARLLDDLEQRFLEFEAAVADWPLQ